MESSLLNNVLLSDLHLLFLNHGIYVTLVLLRLYWCGVQVQKVLKSSKGPRLMIEFEIRGTRRVNFYTRDGI